MNAEFLRWLVESSDKWSLEQKQSFLLIAKSEPERAVFIISSNLNEWAITFMHTGLSGEVLELDHDHDPREIFAAYQKHFAAELAVTEPVATE
ncbi:MAG: hypothetical protein WCS89_04345 [Candidatus Paceibacterota bacterium]